MTHLVFLPVVLMADDCLNATALLVFNTQGQGFSKSSLRWKAREGRDLIAVVTTLVTSLFIVITQVSTRIMDLMQQPGNHLRRRSPREDETEERQRARHSSTQIFNRLILCVCVFASGYSEERRSISICIHSFVRDDQMVKEVGVYRLVNMHWHIKGRSKVLHDKGFSKHNDVLHYIRCWIKTNGFR